MMKANSSKIDGGVEGKKCTKRLGVRRKRRNKAAKMEVAEAKLSDSVISKKKNVRRRCKKATSQILPDENSRETSNLYRRASPLVAAFGPKPKKLGSTIKANKCSRIFADEMPSLAKKTKKRKSSSGSNDPSRSPRGARKAVKDQGRVIAEVEQGVERAPMPHNWPNRAPPSAVKKMVETSTPSARLHVQNFIRDLQRLQVERRKALRGGTAA